MLIFYTRNFFPTKIDLRSILLFVIRVSVWITLVPNMQQFHLSFRMRVSKSEKILRMKKNHSHNYIEIPHETKGNPFTKNKQTDSLIQKSI